MDNRRKRDNIVPIKPKKRQQKVVFPPKMDENTLDAILRQDLKKPAKVQIVIERIPKTHRYRVTETGLRTALFSVRLYARALRQALAWDGVSPASRAGHAAYQRLEHAMDAYLKEVHLAA